MVEENHIDKPRRVLVIGLDGATFDLIHRWDQQGLLPTFRRMMSNGVYGPLRTVIPPLTGPAWISFLTGKNPGKHGIYDFVIRSRKHYYGTPINASHRSGESLWSLLNQANKCTGVFMVPATYPPEPVNGFMVTGMLTPAGATDFIYPPDLAPDLMAAVPGLTEFEDIMHPLGREHTLLKGLDRLTESTMKATDYLMERYDWDFYMVVFKEPDVAMHWLWRFMDPEHPWYTQADEALKFGVQRVYERMDACLAQLLKKVGEDTLVVIMSDHGAGSLATYFHVNTWLIDEGFIRLKKDVLTQAKRLLYKSGFTPISLYKLMMSLNLGRNVSQTMRHRKTSAISLLRRVFLSFESVDWSTTRAYSLGNYGQIFINLKGREPHGIVSPGTEYEHVIADITGRLENLTDPRTGNRIPGKIYRGIEIYHGEKMDLSPDLVFMPDDLRVNGFGMYQFPSKSWLEPTFDRSGGHRMDGIFLMSGPGVKKGLEISNPGIMDIAPTILAAMGLPVPGDMDGKVLEQAFADGYFQQLPITYSEGKKSSISNATELSEEEEDEIRERLRGLGYMA